MLVYLTFGLPLLLTIWSKYVVLKGIPIQEPPIRDGSTKVGLLAHFVVAWKTTTKNCNDTLLRASKDSVELKSSICTAAANQPIQLGEYDMIHSLWNTAMWID